MGCQTNRGILQRKACRYLGFSRRVPSYELKQPGKDRELGGLQVGAVNRSAADSVLDPRRRDVLAARLRPVAELHRLAMDERVAQQRDERDLHREVGRAL